MGSTLIGSARIVSPKLPVSLTEKSSFLAFFVILKSYEALGLFYLKLTANGLNNSQHCWPNKAGSCCVRLHVAKRLTGLKLCAATPNNMQQGVQTDACANGRNV